MRYLVLLCCLVLAACTSLPVPQQTATPSPSAEASPAGSPPPPETPSPSYAIDTMQPSATPRELTGNISLVWDGEGESSQQPILLDGVFLVSVKVPDACHITVLLVATDGENAIPVYDAGYLSAELTLTIPRDTYRLIVSDSPCQWSISLQGDTDG